MNGSTRAGAKEVEVVFGFSPQNDRRLLFGFGLGRVYKRQMEMIDTAQLLRDYVGHGNERAFTELVNRHINLVYSTALRQVGGNVDLAKEVAQMVFIDLARKAKSLSPGVILSGWLYRHSCFTASKLLRAERRRQTREREAIAMNTNSETDGSWRSIVPMLDDAMHRLNNRDRDAVLLRFFEQRTFKAVGTSLGLSEDAARMRVDRALEKLRAYMTKRGAALSATTLAATLKTHAVTAAPAGLAGSIASASLSSAAAAGGIAFSLVELIGPAKVKAGATAAVAASLGFSLVFQEDSLAALRDENAALQQQVSLVENLRAEYDRLSSAKALQSNAGARQELIRLRSEVGQLREPLQQIGRRAAGGRVPFEPVEIPLDPALGTTIPYAAFTDAGTQTPSAAFSTYVWAIFNGNTERLLEAVDFPFEPAIARQRFQAFINFIEDGKVSDEMAPHGHQFRFVDLTPAEIEAGAWLTMDILEPGQEANRFQMLVRRIDGQWRIAQSKAGAGVGWGLIAPEDLAREME